MKTVGEVLHHSREKQKISLAQIAQATHIREEFLSAIESDSFDELPNDVSARGFISLFAQELGLDPRSILALYRRDVKVEQKDLRPLHARFRAMNQRRTVRSLLYALGAGIGLGLLAFSISFVYRIQEAPPLRVLRPVENSTVISPFVIQGSSASDAVVEVDGEAVGVNQDGEFASEQNLGQGLHIITIKAKGRNGKERFMTLTVTVESSDEATK